MLKRFFQSEIGAAVAWVLGSLLMAAVVSPWLFRGGRELGALVSAKDLPGWVEWLGAACARAKFGRFFDRSFLTCALVFLPLLYWRVRGLRSPGTAPLQRPVHAGTWKSAALQVLTGLLIAGTVLWLTGFSLGLAGAFQLRTDSPSAGRLLAKVLVPAVAASLLEEWLFRGVLLGLWLRFARPSVACLGTSLLFAFLHFLQPPSGALVADPSHPLAGFELLGKIILHFTEPLFFVTDFASLLLVGLILAWARVRTGALWFSIGLHAGWILAFKGFNLFYQDVDNHPLRPWGVGDSIRSGVVPLLALAFTAWICSHALRRFGTAQPRITVTTKTR